MKTECTLVVHFLDKSIERCKVKYSNLPIVLPLLLNLLIVTYIIVEK